MGGKGKGIYIWRDEREEKEKKKSLEGMILERKGS